MEDDKPICISGGSAISGGTSNRRHEGSFESIVQRWVASPANTVDTTRGNKTEKLLGSWPIRRSAHTARKMGMIVPIKRGDVVLVSRQSRRLRYSRRLLSSRLTMLHLPIGVALLLTILFSSIKYASAHWIDPDTPLNKRTTKSLVDNTIYHLVSIRIVSERFALQIFSERKQTSI